MSKTRRKNRSSKAKGKAAGKYGMTTLQHKQNLLIIKSRAMYLKRTIPTTWFADGKCLEGVRHNIEPGPFALDLVDLISTKPLPWRVWMGVFQIDSWGKPFVTSDIPPADTLPDKATSEEMGAHVDGMLEELVKGCNQKHVISWGWFAIPNADADLAEMEPGIIEQFTDWNAFNADHCEKVHGLRMDIESVYKEESAA